MAAREDGFDDIRGEKGELQSPAVMSEAKGTSAGVALMTALMVDIDSGDTNAAAKYLTKHIGEPSMVVGSGGTTETATSRRATRQAS